MRISTLLHILFLCCFLGGWMCIHPNSSIICWARNEAAI